MFFFFSGARFLKRPRGRPPIPAAESQGNDFSTAFLKTCLLQWVSIIKITFVGTESISQRIQSFTVGATNFYGCPNGCGRSYKHKKNVFRHVKFECGILPQFECPFCSHRTKQKINMDVHIKIKHPERCHEIAF